MSHDVTSLSDLQRLTERLIRQNQFAMKLGLDAMRQALAMRGLTTPAHRVVLVAGTNGKGTAASTLATLLTAAGLRVGLYTSPHLVSPRERLRIQGAPISQDDLVRLMGPILDAFTSAEANPRLSFFELMTLLAVAWFEEQRVDIAVYEVGLGGRLDATNALEPELTLMTSIGYDHQRQLGDTLGEIFAEKLATRREGAPLIVSAQEYAQVDAHLTALSHTPLYVFARNFGISAHTLPTRHVPERYRAARRQARARAPGATPAPDEHIWWYRDGQHFELTPSDWGMFQAPHQRAHLAAALCAASHLLGAELAHHQRWFDALHTRPVIASMRWPGRMDRRRIMLGVPGAPVDLLCDAAHNADGVSALFTSLERSRLEPTLVIASMVQDKDLRAMLTPLTRLGHPLELCLVPMHNARAATPEQLRDASHALGLADRGEVVTLTAALARAAARAAHAQHRGEEPPLVLVYGSIFLLGEVFEALGITCEDLALSAP